MLPNLKMALAARGIRQIELAQKLDIPSDLFSRIVRGWTQPTVELRERIAEALQADESWLFSSEAVIPAPRLRPMSKPPLQQKASGSVEIHA
jgi:transcriptional regulator with XRE-family HTH domain